MGETDEPNTERAPTPRERRCPGCGQFKPATPQHFYRAWIACLECEGRAIAAGHAAAEEYAARSRETGEPPTPKGLRAAMRAAVDAQLARPPGPRPKRRVKGPHDDSFADWAGAVRQLARLEANLPALVEHIPGLNNILLKDARAALPRLAEWVRLLET
jgi:hypothetical protein